jgi:hypothetical protein
MNHSGILSESISFDNYACVCLPFFFLLIFFCGLFNEAASLLLLLSSSFFLNFCRLCMIVIIIIFQVQLLKHKLNLNFLQFFNLLLKCLFSG